MASTPPNCGHSLPAHWALLASVLLGPILDPQIHTHAVVANVTELDGKWKALATDAI
ncbi:relaxase domain-containing protein, partial [Pantoea sp. B_10]